MRLRGGLVVEPVVELPPLAVDRHPVGEPAQPAGVVVVEVAEADGDDVIGMDADELERHLERIAAALQELGADVPAVEAPVESPVAHERVVEPRVEQQPTAVDLQQEARHRLPQSHRGVGAVDRHRPREIRPAEGERNDPRDTHQRDPERRTNSGCHCLTMRR